MLTGYSDTGEITYEWDGFPDIQEYDGFMFLPHEQGIEMMMRDGTRPRFLFRNARIVRSPGFQPDFVFDLATETLTRAAPPTSP